MPKLKTTEFDDGKFIVINTKRFAEMNAKHYGKYFDENPEIALFLIALERFNKAYGEATGKKLDQKYIVCNQDEPYAERVKAIILGKETARDAQYLALLKTCGEALGAVVTGNIIGGVSPRQKAKAALAALREAEAKVCK